MIPSHRARNDSVAHKAYHVYTIMCSIGLAVTLSRRVAGQPELEILGVQRERSEIIKRASYVAIIGNSFLAVLKIVSGLLSGSLAVVGDGIDTTTDIITSVITLLAAMMMTKPPDKEHPYGNRRVEVLATKLVSFVIFFVGAQLVLSTARSLISGTHPEIPSRLAIYVTIVSIVGKMLLALSLYPIGRNVDSSMTIANAKNMINDIVVSAAVLLGLLSTRLFERPIIDTALALGVGVWVMRTAVAIFVDSSVEIMGGVRDSAIYQEIFASVDSVDGASNPHRTRIRQFSNLYVVDLDVEVDSRISVAAGHEIAKNLEQTIHDRVRNIYDIIVHIEPRGNSERDEKYGRSETEG